MYHGERLNASTHLAGTLLAMGGAAVLVAVALHKGADSTRLVSFSIYGITLTLLYLTSTIYHSVQGRVKDVFRKLDYCAIYLVIAGTYTPFALVALKGAEGWTLLWAVWALALVGIVQECWVAKGKRLTSLAIYVLMGWLALFTLDPLFAALTVKGVTWMLGGGLIYTVGIVFYLLDERVAHFHGIWHLFVIAGSAMHYATIMGFLA
jgi:hemolysin III